MKNPLLNKLLKNSVIKEAAPLNESLLFTERDSIPTEVPMINVALSGSFDRGLTCGTTVLAGPSKHFKSLFALVMVAGYLKKYEDAAVIFYDTEWGLPKHYFDALEIPMDRVLHVPVKTVEELKVDVVKQLDAIERGEHVIIVIDSVGNLASLKELDDALEGKNVADMSRAKALKSLFRLVTGYLNSKNIPMICINHTYKTLEMFSKDVVSGGTGIYYNADNIWIIGRQQDSEGKGSEKVILGYDFIINIEKSRYVKEKAKIPISVTFEKGIDRWSGLFDLALEGEFIVSPTKGWYQIADSDKKLRKDELLQDNSFWKKLVSDKGFIDFIEQKYKLSGSPLISHDDDDDVSENKESVLLLED